MLSKYVDVDGIPINYFHTGPSTLPDVVPCLDRGKMLLLLHGAGSNAHTWHRQIEYFGERHSAVAFDFPAHGRSGSTAGLATIEAHVRLTKALVDVLQLRPAVLVGSALGGVVALEFTLAHPRQVRALVLLATPAVFEIPPATLDTWYDVTRGRKTQPFSTAPFSKKTDLAVMREVWMEQVKTDPRVRYTDMLACDGVDLRPRASGLATPTLVITGREDSFAPPYKAEELQRATAGAELAVVEDAGHALPNEQPEAFNRAVEAFVAGIDRRVA